VRLASFVAGTGYELSALLIPSVASLYGD